MFLTNSRYAEVAQEETHTRQGRSVTALKLRLLPPTRGAPYSINEGERLDLLAHEKYTDGTRYWHIADANRALEAGELTSEAGGVLNLPET